MLVDRDTCIQCKCSIEEFQDELFNLIVSERLRQYVDSGDSLFEIVEKAQREFSEESAGLKEIACSAATTICLLTISVNAVSDVVVTQSRSTDDKQRIEQVKQEVVNKLNKAKYFIQGWQIIFELISGQIKASKKKVE